jgi:PadR family transcriptional regulator, regulatory protein AphA
MPRAPRTPLAGKPPEGTPRTHLPAKPPTHADDPALGAPAYVVLGMLRLGARSGYEIKQAVELSIRYFWTISQAQIYPSLERLERAGLVHGRSDPQGRRPRRVFEITEAGQAALEGWLRRDEPMALELRDVGLLKLFFADALDQDDAGRLLLAVKRRSEERVAALRAIAPAAQLLEDDGNAHPLLTLRIGIAYHQAMIDQCEEFGRSLGRTSQRQRDDDQFDSEEKGNGNDGA